MVKKYILISIVTFISGWSYGQVGIGTTTPTSKAMLEIASNNGSTFKGFMPPRVPDDAAKLAIAPGAAEIGLIIYVEKTKALEVWNGNAWQRAHRNSTSGTAKDLFISEYVQNSSGSNNAVEIANFTGKAVNLGEYELIVNTNGGVPPTDSASAGSGGISISTITLSPITLQSGEVHVVRNSSASNIGIGQAASNVTFDGNDAVILRKKGLGQPWIDVVGVPRVNWEFGKTVTLRRKPGYGPSKLYVPEQFDVLPVGTYGGLGSHTF